MVVYRNDKKISKCKEKIFIKRSFYLKKNLEIVSKMGQRNDEKKPKLKKTVKRILSKLE